MTLTISIGGVDMTGSSHFVDSDSITHASTIGQWDTCSFRIISADGSYKPAIGAAVVVTIDGTARFGGNIRQLKVIEFGAALKSEVGCSSWEQLFTRRPTGVRSYTDTAAGDVFQDLLTNCMGGDGLTASIVLSGPNITAAFNFVTVREAFDQIVALASTDTETYIWDCTPDKVVRFYRNDSFAAPFDIDDTSTDVLQEGASVRLSASFSLDKYCNRVYPSQSKLILDPTTETFIGDGARQVFTVGYPIALVPEVMLFSEAPTLGASVTEYFTGDGYTVEWITSQPIGSLSSVSGITSYTWDVNSRSVIDTSGTPVASGDPISITYQPYTGTGLGAGVAQTVGIGDVDSGKDWYWNENSADVRQDAGGTALTSSQTLQITYQGYDSRVIAPIQNDAEVAARAAAEGTVGYYSQVLPSDVPGTAVDATARAQAWLDKFSQIPCTIEYRSPTDGLRAGQHQTIADTDLGVSSTFLLESVTMTQVNGYFLWAVRAVAGALTGDYKMRLRELKQAVGSSAQSTVIIGGSGDTGAVKINGVPVTY